MVTYYNYRNGPQNLNLIIKATTVQNLYQTQGLPSPGAAGLRHVVARIRTVCSGVSGLLAHAEVQVVMNSSELRTRLGVNSANAGMPIPTIPATMGLAQGLSDQGRACYRKDCSSEHLSPHVYTVLQDEAKDVSASRLFCLL